MIFAALAGLLFGLVTVAVRYAFMRGGDAVLGAAAIPCVAAVIALVIALPSLAEGVGGQELLPFVGIGLFVPGIAQLVFVTSVREAGAARAGIVIGTAPIFSVLFALVLLGEGFSWPIAMGTVLVVLGGIAFVRERERPSGFRVRGLVLALICAILFAMRDNGVRWFSRDEPIDPAQATLVAVGTAAVLTLLSALIQRRGVGRGRWRASFLAFAPAGVCLGLAYAALVTALDRGPVSTVAPLNATQSLWTVVGAAVFFRQHEAINRRTVLAASLVVAGAALVAASR